MTTTGTSPQPPAPLPWGHTWPAQAEFLTMAPHRRVIPVVRRLLADDVTPVGLYRQLSAGREGTFILESAGAYGVWSRWAVVGVTAEDVLTSHAGKEIGRASCRERALMRGCV